ncbi:MAG: hypothetical protein AAF799_07890 [Myxococcota bacterium]
MSRFLLVPTWLALAAPPSSDLAPGEVDAVELPWSRYQAMRENLAGPQGETPGPWMADRDVELRPVHGGWELRARWEVRAEQPGWVWEPLASSTIEVRSVSFRGEPATILPWDDGVHLTAFLDRPGTLELRGFVPGSPDDPLELGLMPAATGRLRVLATDRVPVPLSTEAGLEAPPLRIDDTLWSGATRLRFRLEDPDQAPPSRETLAVAYAGVGLTIDDAEIRGRAHLQWELRRGSLDRVRTTIAGLGEDLSLRGRNVASWSRQGDVLEVELSAPATGRVDLDLEWSQAVPAGDEATLELPRIEPEAWRSEASLQLARDGELEIVPHADDWTATAAGELPSWGQGLVAGTPTAAYHRTGGHGSGSLDLLRFVPVPGPPTVVDVATYTVATTEEGRVLMRARYELRNDRGAHLEVTPPPGLKIIGARVGGETALPTLGEDGAWRLPLKRSLETVEGLLSFPVEVTLLGEQDPWARRERRELALPTLDAPVAASRVTMHLPPGYRSKLDTGQHDTVEYFNDEQGLTYGHGVSDALFDEAVRGYMSNDFEAAQEKLEELERMGIRNDNTARLQSNLDVFEGKGKADDKADLTLQRRVKEQARARASEQFREQEKLIVEAEESAKAGDYSAAEAQYQQAIELGGTLAKLEQRESVEQVAVNSSLKFELESVADKRGKKAKRARRSRKAKSKNTLDTKMPASAPAKEQPLLELERASRPVVAESGAEEAEEPPAVTEPEPEMPLPRDADASLDLVVVEGRPGRWKSRRRRRARKPDGDRFRLLQGRSAASVDSGVTVYDFEDDNVDGEILSPQGATISARARSTSPAGPPIETLPAPKVTASALSVVIPDVGNAVLYERVLIEANQTHTVTIDARRRLVRR